MAFRPLTSKNSLPQNLGEINNMVRQINKEQTVKTFKQANGNAIVQGRLPYDGGYGSVYYDSTGKARILIGINPDGDIGLYISKADEDVIEDVFS